MKMPPASISELRWPNGAVCPRCNSAEVAKVVGKKQSHRPGLYYCNGCEGTFTVTVGTVLERSKIPLAKWALGFHLMASSKKGVSAHQLHRALGITYKSAWFLAHRIREAMGMKPEETGPIGGENKVVESDETYIGGKARNAHKNKPIPKKHPVVTLIERDGTVRATHVPNVTAKTVGEHLAINVDAKSHLMTDDSMVYVTAGRHFAGHSAVNHSAEEYVKLGGFAHVNTAESFHAS